MKRLTVEYDNGDIGFKILEYIDENGVVYTVEGQCSRCGQCCMNPKYAYGFDSEPGRCSKLEYQTVNGVVCYNCTIYDRRPVCCFLGPNELEDLIVNDKCTFKFVKKIV